jgi:hypothetical protein
MRERECGQSATVYEIKAMIFKVKRPKLYSCHHNSIKGSVHLQGWRIAQAGAVQVHAREPRTHPYPLDQCATSGGKGMWYFERLGAPVHPHPPASTRIAKAGHCSSDNRFACARPALSLFYPHPPASLAHLWRYRANATKSALKPYLS